MPDLLNLYRTGGSTVFQNLTKKISGVSPTRMMWINPRKFFDPGDEFDYSKVLKEVLLTTVQEFASNVVDQHIPGANLLVAAAESYIPTLVKDSDSKFFMFYLSPQTMKVSHQKIAQETLTGGGWDFDVLGDQLSTYTFSGTSGSFLEESFDFKKMILFDLSLSNLKMSRAFFKFAAMEQFYLYNNNDSLMFVLDQTAYIGKLVNMSWNWAADDIYQIKYDFAWRMNPLFSFDIFSGAGVTTLFNASKLKDLFNPELREDLFTTKFSKIDTYEERL